VHVTQTKEEADKLSPWLHKHILPYLWCLSLYGWAMNTFS